PRVALGRDSAPGVTRAGEADRIDATIVDERFANDAAAAHHEIEYAGWHTGVSDKLGECPRRSRHELRRLEHHAVAISKRRRDFPCRDGDGKIPRRDETDNAEWLAGNLHVHAGTHRGNLLSRQVQRFAAEELEDLPGTHHFANTFGERLAFFTR